MKKIKIFAFVAVFSLAFSSCSSDELILPQQEGKELFKSYQLKRDASGAYSIDFDLNNNAKVSKTKNSTTNTNELYLTLSDFDLVQKNSSESDLWFDDNNFTIELINDNYSKISSISVFDDNAKFAQKTESSFLKELSVTKNEDGTYGLDFTVQNKVSVDFVYNAEINVHEIHLEESAKSNKNNNFSRILEKEQNKLLQIHFVNHTKASAKGEFAEAGPRKPVIIIDEGENG